MPQTVTGKCGESQEESRPILAKSSFMRMICKEMRVLFDRKLFQHLSFTQILNFTRTFFPYLKSAPITVQVC